MTTRRITKKKIDVLGGIGSILVGFMCVGIGWMDYTSGRAWHIWAVMTLVLLVNGVAMLTHAFKSTNTAAAGSSSGRESQRVARARL
jgi:hypothetical protein